MVVAHGLINPSGRLSRHYRRKLPGREWGMPRLVVEIACVPSAGYMPRSGGGVRTLRRPWWGQFFRRLAK